MLGMGQSVVLLRQYAALLRQTTEGTDALAKRQEAEERHLLDRTEQVLQLDHTEQIWGLCRTYERLWKTSVAQTREECAVIAETAADVLQNSTFDGVAAAIRALKVEPTQTIGGNDPEYLAEVFWRDRREK